MNTNDLLNTYTNKVEVIYKGEQYLVRDNGAIYRKQKPDSRKRPLDETWTFGKMNQQKRYMFIGSHEVHRIVAYAFLGNPPSQSHVVDHIDTNKCNNRPENLRWVTRLENIILNPITLKRILIAYGSLDQFFENPSFAKKTAPNIAWMRTVSKEEAQKCREQLLNWANSDNIPNGGALSEWVYKTRQSGLSTSFSLEDKPSLTPIAIQRNWKWLVEFPSCPDNFDMDPLEKYIQKLHHNAIFTQNKYGKTYVEIAEKGDKLISVIASVGGNTVKPWAVTKITVENQKYVHESIGTFFKLNGAKKAHYKLLNIPFEGESIDDYL